MMACIHRGAREVGGSCVELRSGDSRLVVDLGLPLWANPDQQVPLPEIPGLVDGSDAALLGVIVSHGHPDHYGLLDRIAPEVPIYIGEATARILNEAAFFTGGSPIDPAGPLRDRNTLTLGPFRVTPLLVDQSAFDSYALLIEAHGRRLLYTGDLRAHGRKSGTFEQLLEDPPQGVHVLLMEGTRLGRSEASTIQSEREVEDAFCETIEQTDGIVLALYSPQNVDRYVSIYKAAVRSGRHLVIDLYAAAISAATGRESIPQATWDRVKVFVPQAQRIKVKQRQAFDRVDQLREVRLFPEQLESSRDELVLTFRASMARDLERANCLQGAAAVWSMWPGYLEEARSEPLRSFLDRHAIPLSVIHASGHARVADLKRLVEAVSGDRLVPIHTVQPDQYERAFGAAKQHPDGEWWEV